MPAERLPQIKTLVAGALLMDRTSAERVDATMELEGLMREAPHDDARYDRMAETLHQAYLLGLRRGSGQDRTAGQIQNSPKEGA